jgi:hypothetical protein
MRDPSPSLSRVAADTVTEGRAQHPAAGDAAFGETSRRRAAESGAPWHADIGESNNRFEGLESDLFAGLG